MIQTFGFPVLASIGVAVDADGDQPGRDHVVTGFRKGHVGPRFPFADGACDVQ